ncbi:hypothetical protein ACWKSP_34465 [Micromonosporaceae bacterium Da 78-11]
MDETTGGPDGVRGIDAFPNVTRIPLLGMAPEDDNVLDAAIRRVVEDAIDQRDITASFGSTP